MDLALPLARACATLRQALQSGQSSGQLRAVDSPREQLRALSGQGPWVGRSPVIAQGLEIVTGQPRYASDIRLPGMVYGRVLRAPVPPEIPLQAGINREAAARPVAGFVAIVRHPLLQMATSEGLGIVAQTPGPHRRVWQADIHDALQEAHQTGDRYEQMMSSEAFINVGALERMFQLATQVLRDGGGLAFCLEA